MLQTRIHGKDRVAFIESLTVADVVGQSDNTGSLTLFTNDQGGIIDDLIISKTDLGVYSYLLTLSVCLQSPFQVICMLCPMQDVGTRTCHL